MAGLRYFTALVLDISRWSSSYWTMGQMPTASKEEFVISFLKRSLISNVKAEVGMRAHLNTEKMPAFVFPPVP